MPSVSGGTLSPSSVQASAACTARPPPPPTAPTFRPIAPSGFASNSNATNRSISSSCDRTSMAPACRSAPRQTLLEPASAAVCETAERAPAPVRPPLTMIVGVGAAAAVGLVLVFRALNLSPSVVRSR